MENMIKKRFGSYAVDKGFITEDQLVEALAIQARENVKEGKHRLLGQILLDQGFITASQIDEVLETMSRSMEYALSVGR
jgi:hypothetical protein